MKRAVFIIACVTLLFSSCFPDGYLNDLSDDQSAVVPMPEPEPELEPDFCGVPVIRLEIENGGDITSKDEYVNVSVSVSEGDRITLEAKGRAKGRGNATWGYDKKPYKIKFDEKQCLLNFPENKDWVLLAEYCDKSLMRTAYMCELAQTAGLPYPIRYRHVHLYLNGKYNGLYVLTDQVEKKKYRVDIADDGFLFENDNYFWEEPVNFMTETREYWYTFKYPDPEDGEISYGDESYEFIKSYMNDLECALYGDDFKDPEKGYRKYIDVETFAKWFLVQELTANLEPNMYYVLPSRNARLQIAPVWDAEWSLGLAYREDEYSGWASLPTEPDPDQQIWTKWKYFGRLFEDPFFVDTVRDEWMELSPLLPDFCEKMSLTAGRLVEAQAMNFDRWQTLDWHVSVGLVCLKSWEKEVEYVEDFFSHRVSLMNSFLLQD